MLLFKLPRYLVDRKLIYFAAEPSFKYGFFNQYKQSQCLNSKRGYKRTPKLTKIIDISTDAFIENFDKNTRYEIRKAQADKIECEILNDVNAFIYFYNQFLLQKNIPGNLKKEELKMYNECLIVRVALSTDKQILVAHSYLLDSSIKRVRLLHSASKIYDHDYSVSDRALMGRANRLLHYTDMVYFNKNGYTIYDFGGYAHNTNDASLLGINKFKDSFGGIIIEESNYEPTVIYVAKKIMQIIRQKVYGR